MRLGALGRHLVIDDRDAGEIVVGPRAGGGAQDLDHFERSGMFRVDGHRAAPVNADRVEPGGDLPVDQALVAHLDQVGIGLHAPGAQRPQRGHLHLGHRQRLVAIVQDQRLGHLDPVVRQPVVEPAGHRAHAQPAAGVELRLVLPAADDDPAAAHQVLV